MVQQALTNVGRHANAQRLWLRIAARANGFDELEVAEGGRGIDSNAMQRGSILARLDLPPDHCRYCFMYLTAYQTALLARVMTTLAEPHEERDIRTRVGELMLDLLGAQHYASYVWDEEQQRFDSGVRINMDAANLEQYERHYQYHDPITSTLQQYRRAVRVTDVMPQRQLKRTEFFNDFLARDGLYWGVNLYAWSGDRNIGDMRIWRDKRRENFSRDDLELLDLVRPVLVAALHRSRNDKGTPDVTSACSLGPETLLSVREREVAHLAGCGLSDKDIARRLGISITTVRTHIDHAFRKLNVHNRMTLVHKLNL